MNALNKAIEICFCEKFLKPVNSTSKTPLKSIIKGAKNSNDSYKYPFSLTWKIVSGCNLRCKHCYYHDQQHLFDDDKDLHIDDLLKIAQFLVEDIGIFEIKLTGGEIFLKKDILTLIRYLKSKSVYLGLETNGTLITKEIADQLAEILHPKNDYIRISLDGTTAEVHDAIRGKGTFDKTVNAIKMLRNRDINIALNYTVNSLNTEDMVNIPEFKKSLNIDFVIISQIIPCSDKQEYLVPELEKLFFSAASLIKNINEDNQGNNYKFSLFKIFNYTDYDIGKRLLSKYIKENNICACEYVSCNDGETMTVSPDGNVYYCMKAGELGLTLGNILKQSFYEIWEKRFENLLYKPRKIADSPCIKCEYVPLCGGECPITAYTKYKTLVAPHLECNIGRELMKQKVNYV